MEKNILSARQLDFLELLGQNQEIVNRFYWTGGTVLAEFYLRHRLSEDIDLFTEKEEVNQELIETFLIKSKSQLGFKSIKRSQFLGLFSYFLVYNKNETLKVDFNYYPFERIEKGGNFKNITYDSLYDIAINKVHTIAMKPRARDFIDIFFIVKEKKYLFVKMLADAKIKFDWHIDAIQLGAQLLKAKEVKDYPRMIKKIDHKEWQNFFLNEAKKLKKEIFK